MTTPVFSGVFRFHGRRERRSFVINRLVCWTILLAIWVAVGLADNIRIGDGETDWLAAVIMGALALTLVHVVSGWAVCAQRARDLGWTGWTILVLYIPLFGLFAYLYLLLARGVHGETEYGSDPLASELPVAAR